jgi:hypothetical protein
MPSEPKKPIEELLEASARARRSEFGADGRMPNPMRAQLHEEIVRLDRRDKPQERRSWLANFWPQLSLATAVAAVLVTASVVWFRTQNKTSESSLSLAVQTAPVVASNETNGPLRSLDAMAVDRLAKDNGAKPADSVVAEESQLSSGRLADAATAGAAPDAPPSEVAQAPATAKAAVPAPVARSFAQTRQTQTANLRQRFSQNIAQNAPALSENKMKQQRSSLLNTFDVQQEGDRIRVVDEDGSTYTGKLEQIAQHDARSLSQKKEQKAAAQSMTAMKPGEQTESNEFFFRAAGFNATLKKQVVFEANYIAAPAENQQNKAMKEQRRDEQNAARIVGTAKVPGQAPVEVDAVSVTR